MAATCPTLVQWMLDTRTLWPEVRRTLELETHAARALALLSADERAGVLRYFHAADAKMSLASHLLKHLVVAKLASVPWHATHVTRDARTKPVFVDPSTGGQPVGFNVSHQAGVVAVAAVAGYPAERGPAEVGVDVVCVAERRERDHGIIRRDGWARFVDMHADVFAPGETAYLKYQVLAAVPGLPRDAGPEQVVDFQLRCFYALWNLREAWVKMTGEALLAKWLGELEFRRFRPPQPTRAFDVAVREGSDEVIREHDVVFRGARVEDVQVDLRSMGPDYMIATAMRTRQHKEDGLRWRLGPYEVLDLDEVLNFAEASI